MQKIINISTEFTKYPGPRFERLGSFSGEKFRDEVLVPALQEHDEVVVHLDGTMGYGSSFLEEAFGGTVREKIRIGKDNLHLVSKDEHLVREIWLYIEDAQK